MVKELEKVIHEAKKLSDEDQKLLAENWLNDIKWEISLSQSEDVLAMLAEEAVNEYS